jgi:hypothetical protein
LAVILVAAPAFLLLTYVKVATFGLELQQYAVVSHYAYAWLGGTLGGAVFSIKWLYHTVAKGTWNEDRRLWRIFAPHLSAGLAFAVALLIEGHAITILDRAVVSESRTVVGLSFLVGYFSDPVLGRLADVAKSLFGSSGVGRLSEIPHGGPSVEAPPAPLSDAAGSAEGLSPKT